MKSIKLENYIINIDHIAAISKAGVLHHLLFNGNKVLINNKQYDQLRTIMSENIKRVRK